MVDRVGEGGKGNLPALDPCPDPVLPRVRLCVVICARVCGPICVRGSRAGRVRQVFSPPIQVRRVAVRIVDPDAKVLTAAWLRHGETTVDTLARLVPGAGSLAASLRLSTVRSIPRDVRSGSIRVHLLALDHTWPSPSRRPPDDLLPLTLDETTDPAHLDEVLTAWADGRHTDPLGTQVGRDVMKVQRAGAYAVIRRGAQVLLTRLAHTGRWTLPGGGIDPGEQPGDSLAREVFEETGLSLDGVRLAGVSTARWTGRAPDGVVEDFHAVQVLYTADVDTDAVPHVVERDGSTSEVAWVDLAEVSALPLTYAVRSGLGLVGISLDT